MSPTQRTLKYYRDQGFLCAITEHWNPFAHIRQDLFGFIDIVAIHAGRIIGIQTTSSAHHAERRDKINSLEASKRWLEAGGEIHICSWRKSIPRNVWTPRIEEITKEGEAQRLLA